MNHFVSNEWGKDQYQDLSYSHIRGAGPNIRSLLCFTALGVCLTVFILSLSNSTNQIPSRYVFHFDRQQSILHIVSNKFLSFGLDTSLLRRMNELPIGQEKFINLARHLSPAYVRVGGTSADCLTFVQDQVKEQNSSEKILSPVNGQDISNFTISGVDLLAIYDFTVKSKLRMIFDLNVLLRNLDGSWNDSNAQEIIAFTKNQGMTLDWQLGNEPNSFKHVFNITISASELAKDYDHLRQLLNEAGYVDSILVGPEVNHVGDSNMNGELYAKTFLSNQKNTVNYVTWHQYYLNGREAKVNDFVASSTFNWLPAQINSMKQFIAKSGKNVSMWLSETSTAFGGGAPGLSDRFVAGFLWLDKLGYSAKAGLNVVTRQSLFGGDYAMVSPNLTPNPDWWVSVFYKQFVSEKVLMLFMPDNFGCVRLYAHCTSKKALIARVPAVTIYGMNIDKNGAYVNIPELFVLNNKTVILYYVLTADHLQSSEIKLNGEVLKLRANGDLPPFRPVILYSTNLVFLPPYSMVFMIIHGIDIPACSQLQPWSTVGVSPCMEQVAGPPIPTRIGEFYKTPRPHPWRPTLGYEVVEAAPLPSLPITNLLVDACRTSHGLASEPLKFPNLVTGFDRNPSHAARAALYTRYTPCDWLQNEIKLYNEANSNRCYSEKLRENAACLMREADEKVHEGQVESGRKLGERITDITFWRNEVASELERLIIENGKMQECRHKLQIAIQILEGQLHIAQECLYHRESRKGIDLVHDEVEKALLDEVETVRNCEKKLKQFMDRCVNQLTNSRAAQHQLQMDVQNKETALGIDSVCHQMNNSSRGLQYYGGIEKYDPSVIGTEFWAEATNNIVKKSQTERAKSHQLRNDIENAINAVCYEICEAWAETNKALVRRVDEMLEAKEKLQRHLQKIQEESFNVEKSITLMQKTIADKSPVLKVAHTRLEARTHRPENELCKDNAQFRMIREVEDINKIVYDLNMKLQQSEAQHQQLLRTRSNLESNLKSKTDALFIDKEKCMGLRRNCPILSIVKY